LRGVDL